MQTAVRRRQRLPQERQVAQSIAIVEEAGQAVVATLHYMLRDVGQVEAGEAGHVWEHAGACGWLQSVHPAAMLRVSPSNVVRKVNLAPLTGHHRAQNGLLPPSPLMLGVPKVRPTKGGCA